RNDSTGDRLRRLEQFLDRNHIVWGNPPVATYLGLNYETGRMAQFKTTESDLVIAVNQPKSNLIRVLFERQSRISDSITYDITAWLVPFVYGLAAYGLNSFGGGQKPEPEQPAQGRVPELPDTTYAYAVRWAGLNSAR